MRKIELDYTFRDREESEKLWNEPVPINSRLARWFIAIGAIAVQPIEMVAELFVMILRFIAVSGSLILWATNPITKEKQTESEEES
jgi:hypothetical protein